MTADTLTDQQRAFLEKYLRKGFGSDKRNERRTSAFESYVEAETAFRRLVAEIPKEHPRMAQLVAALRPVIDAKNDGRFDEAAEAMDELVTGAGELKRALLDRKQRQLERLRGLADPDGAPDGAKRLMQAERDRVAEALAPAVPKPAAFAAADSALDALDRLVQETTGFLRRREDIARRLEGLAEPKAALPREKAAMRAERDRIAPAVTGAVLDDPTLRTAEAALDTLAALVAAARERIGKALRSLSDRLGTLTVPVHATNEEAPAIATERGRVEAVVSGDPTAEELAGADQMLEGIAERIARARQGLERRRREIADRLPGLADPPGALPSEKAAMRVERDRAEGVVAAPEPTAAEMAEASRALDRLARLVQSAKDALEARRRELADGLRGITDPGGIEEEDARALAAERGKVQEVIDMAAFEPEDFAKAKAALGTLADLVADLKNLPKSGRRAIQELERTSPKAARKARETLSGFTREIGDLEVTPQVFEEAGKALADARKAVRDAKAALAGAGKLPQGTEEERQTRQRAIAAARQRLEGATTALGTTEKRSNAIMGRKLLGEAITWGPLSPVAPKPLSDEGAEKFAAAFARDPAFAGEALGIAATATHPEAVAANVGPLLDRAGTGFVSASGRAFNDPDHARSYARSLLEAGAEIGPDYFGGLDAYIRSGAQFEGTPLGPTPPSFVELQNSRARDLAGKFVRDDGTIDVTSPAAERALAHLQYSPDVLRNAQPSLTRSVLKTVAMLKDPVTGPQAQTVLDGVTAPTDGGALKILRGALGKGETDPVSDAEARRAVLQTLLTPLDQGPVGSCFATSPARRMRETQPIEAMKAFAEIATTGTYQPATGPRVPAVTNVPEKENPLLRAWEYTLATAAARKANSNQKRQLVQATSAGIDQMQGLVDPAVWNTTKAKLRTDVAGAFTFVYDPLASITGSGDGSSSQGRYVIQHKSDGKAIRTKEDFIEAMTGIALASMGLAAGTAEGDKVVDMVKSDPFVNAVCPGKYRPWELASGGQTAEAVDTLFGGNAQTREFLPEVPTGGTKPPEGERTRAVLENFLGAFQGRTDEMVTIRTVGKHGFNALPNHPSLAPLKGANPTETAQKVQTNLIDRGQALRDTRIPAERAAYMFDGELDRRIGAEKNDELKGLLVTGRNANRPNAETKPAGIDAAIKAALAAYNLRKSELEAEEWKRKEEAGGRTVDGPALEKKKQELAERHGKWVDDANRDMLVRSLGAPEFVIADANWGDSRVHAFFVVAPDPVSGEPLLWKKVEPGGRMTPVGRDWVDHAWARVE